MVHPLGTKMKLCAVSDSLGSLSFAEAAKASADLGLEALEIGMGNWSAAPHANLQLLLESKEKRREFLSVFEQNGRPGQTASPAQLARALGLQRA